MWSLSMSTAYSATAKAPSTTRNGMLQLLRYGYCCQLQKSCCRVTLKSIQSCAIIFPRSVDVAIQKLYISAPNGCMYVCMYVCMYTCIIPQSTSNTAFPVQAVGLRI